MNRTNSKFRSVVVLVAFVLAAMLMLVLAQHQPLFEQLVLVVFSAMLVGSGVVQCVVVHLLLEAAEQGQPVRV